MTRPNLRVLGTYRDVYSNRNSSSSSNISQPVTRSNTTTGSSHVNNPYVNNFTDTGTQDVTTLVLFILLVTLRYEQICHRPMTNSTTHIQRSVSSVLISSSCHKVLVWCWWDCRNIAMVRKNNVGSSKIIKTNSNRIRFELRKPLKKWLFSRYVSCPSLSLHFPLSTFQ